MERWRKPVGMLLMVLAVIWLMTGCGRSSSQTGEGSAGGKKVNFPEKPINIIVPYAAGGSTDALARAVEKVWSKYCNQPVVIVNKAGAGGVEGRDFVKKSSPDGYTLMIGYGSGEDMWGPQLQQMPYDPLKDFVAVSRLSIHSTIICVPASSQFKTLKELIDWAKASKQPVTAAVSTATGNVNITMRGIGKVTGINIVPIPHQGGAQAVTTLVGGHAMIGGGSANEVMTHIKAGRLRALAVDLPQRDPCWPDVPTLREQGVDFHSWGSIKGVAAPAGTPKEVIDYLDGIFKKISEDPDFKKTMNDLAQPILYQGADEFAKFLKEVYEYNGKLIKELDIRIQ